MKGSVKMNKHSKLPWRTEIVPSHGFDEPICAIKQAGSHWNVASCAQSNAAFIVTACNEHDTLKANQCVCNGALDDDEGGMAYCRIAVKLTEAKAKAELFDEMVKAVKEYTQCKLNNDAVRTGFAWYDGDEEALFLNVTDMLTKAKELKE
jgi:hypothetical protein